MIAVFNQISDASEEDEPVLILGETGTGKDLVAQAIHTNSARKNNPCIIINCPAIPSSLMEAELFGSEPGTFTDGKKLRKGHFENASGGTLFLDEIGDMPLEMQAKILRVLQNGEIMRLGSSERIKVDVRVLAATNRDLNARVVEGKFREDLYYRLQGETIRLPPLREREGDVEQLASRFLDRWRGDQASLTLHADALEILENHRWPGNVRQLQNVVRGAVRKCRADRRTEILPQDLVFSEVNALVQPDAADVDENGALASLRRVIAWAWNSDCPRLWDLLQDHLEREILRYAIAQPLISQAQLAQRLGVSKNKLRDRLKRYQLDWPADDE
jgi:transcriptional regulator with GAF, ATPase, and Fis domain